MADLDLTQVNGGFLLRRHRAGKRAVTFRLSADEALGLAKKIALWQDQQLLQSRSGSAGATSIVAYPSAGATVRSDAMGENVLLTLGRSPDQGMTFSLPVNVAIYVQKEIEAVLGELARTEQTRQ